MILAHSGATWISNNSLGKLEVQTTISAPYGTDLNTEPITNNACNCKIGADKLAISVLLILLNKITSYLPLELHISFDKAISEYEKKMIQNYPIQYI